MVCVEFWPDTEKNRLNLDGGKHDKYGASKVRCFLWKVHRLISGNISAHYNLLQQAMWNILHEITYQAGFKNTSCFPFLELLLRQFYYGHKSRKNESIGLWKFKSSRNKNFPINLRASWKVGVIIGQDYKIMARVSRKGRVKPDIKNGSFIPSRAERLIYVQVFCSCKCYARRSTHV